MAWVFLDWTDIRAALARRICWCKGTWLSGDPKAVLAVEGLSSLKTFKICGMSSGVNDFDWPALIPFLSSSSARSKARRQTSNALRMSPDKEDIFAARKEMAPGLIIEFSRDVCEINRHYKVSRQFLIIIS